MPSFIFLWFKRLICLISFCMKSILMKGRIQNQMSLVTSGQCSISTHHDHLAGVSQGDSITLRHAWCGMPLSQCREAYHKGKRAEWRQGGVILGGHVTALYLKCWADGHLFWLLLIDFQNVRVSDLISLKSSFSLPPLSFTLTPPAFLHNSKSLEY